MTTHPPIEIAERHMSPGFRASGLRRAALPLGSLLSVDHFHMSQPTFPPHPHAGFSAVTYMLEDSNGGFTNRDSRGDLSRIGPGALHWTLAGAGVIHEEIPERPGTDCHGLQIFVKLPRAFEEMSPATFHLEPTDIPEVAALGARVRVLVGQHAGTSSPIRLPAPVTLLDVHLEPGAQVALQLPAGEDAVALILAGDGIVAGRGMRRNSALALPAGTVSVAAGASALQLIVAHSPPILDPLYWAGPFCMTDPSRLESAEQRYRSGAMGSLERSFR
jgi:redox-sensitive bicupin YhaK (pirin superfamily)